MRQRQILLVASVIAMLGSPLWVNAATIAFDNTQGLQVQFSTDGTVINPGHSAGELYQMSATGTLATVAVETSPGYQGAPYNGLASLSVYSDSSSGGLGTLLETLTTQSLVCPDFCYSVFTSSSAPLLQSGQSYWFELTDVESVNWASAANTTAGPQFVVTGSGQSPTTASLYADGAQGTLQVVVNPAPVPLPAGVWLLSSGLFGFVVARRTFGVSKSSCA